MVKRRHDDRRGEFMVKPHSFLPEITDINEQSNPPITPEDATQLMNRYDIRMPELTRLGLFVYGIDPGDHPVTGRQDGVIAGIDTYASRHRIPVTRVNGIAGEPHGIDLDAGRLAAFISRREDTPYAWVNDEVHFWGKPTGLYMAQFPKDGFSGQFYVRTDRNGKHTRAVINPRPSCESSCRWCARTYGERKKLLGEQLDRRVRYPDELIDDMVASTSFRDLGGFPEMTEINFVSGDFLRTEKMSQSDYLIDFVQRARRLGFRGNWYYAGHQAFDEADVQKLHDSIGSGTMCYTLEHLTRREDLMPVKGKVPLDAVSDILRRTSRIMGNGLTQYYLIAGLDPTDTVTDWITSHRTIATPQLHVFTPYAPSHYTLAHGSRKRQIEQALEIRAHVLKTYGRPIHSGSNRSLFPIGALE